MQFNEQDIKDILAALTEIKERLAAIEALQEKPSAACAVHNEKLDELFRRVGKAEDKLGDVQQVIGKKELIVAAFGAIGVGIGFAIKALVGFARG